MYSGNRVSLLKFLKSLSDALELAFPRLAHHQLRVAYMAQAISERLGQPQERSMRIAIAALLHDVGALSPEEKVELRESRSNQLESHCIIGAKLLERSIAPLRAIAPVVRFHHSQWRDEEARSCGDSFLDAQIVGLADAVERAIDRDRYVLEQDRDIIASMKAQAGDGYAPDVVDAFASVASREEYWLDIVSTHLPAILEERLLCSAFIVGEDDLYALSRLSRDIIDFRSPFTATHSGGVAATASMFASSLGLSDLEAKELAIAGNLHDIGKMAVPNRILLKEGRLTGSEFAIIRQHTYHTFGIVRNMGFQRAIVESAAFHHEKLDGTGYPFHIRHERIGIGPRILTIADILNALTEARPYRAGMDYGEALAILKTLAGSGAVDPLLVRLLESRYEAVIDLLEAERRSTLDAFEAGLMRGNEDMEGNACG